MRAATIAGLAYSAIIFLFAFGMGALRVLVVAPRIGEVGAVVAELPVVLAASWWVCGRVLRRFAVSPRLDHRLVMAGIALVALQALEASAAIGLFARSPDDYLRAFLSPGGAIGLAGQGLFALIPLARSRR